jgi:DNA-binding CsgD family transcriptional regulator
MPVSIVGREAELGAIGRFLEETAAAPAVLVVEGDAGVGKTTLWRAGLEAAEAAGLQVLSTRGAGAEVRLGYAGLGDLLVGLESRVLARLPAPQRRALETALLHTGAPDGPAPDPRAVATGLSSALGLLAAEGPLLVAIDDLQWLDASSAAALRFAVRRLAGPVGVLAALRREAGEGVEHGLELRDPGHVASLAVGPMGEAEIHSLLRARGRVERPSPVLARITEVAGGNPFLALELERTIDPDRVVPAAELPASLREIVDARLAALGAGDRRAVLYASMLTRPLVPMVEAALGGDAAAGLSAAEAEGILALDGARVTFSHPLLAAGAYAAASPAERREAHRRIAAVTEGEERARHLALGSISAEPEAIAALDSAAAAARARGASSDAAELLELALRLGAEEPARRQLAAEHHLDAGNLPRARALFEELIGELPTGSARARALGGIGTIHRLTDDVPGSRGFLERAGEETEDRRHRCELLLELAFACTQAGLIQEALPHSETAAIEAEGLEDPGILAQALAVRTMGRFLVGEGLDEGSLARCLALEDEERRTPGVLRPTLVAGLLLMWVGRLEEANVALGKVHRQCRQRGEEGDLVYMTMHQGTLACARGDVAHGSWMVESSLEWAWRLGSPTSRAVALENQVVVAGWTGDVETARAAAAEAIELYRQVRSPVGEMFVGAALGRVELSLGRYGEAAEQLLPAAQTAAAMGAGDPDTLPAVAEALEALVALGRAEEAERLGAWLRERAGALGRPTQLASAARCDGILRTAAGELEEAEACFERALVEHERLVVPFERARTLLLLGQLQRRRRRRAAARETLGRAGADFERLGAALWAERARAELERVDAGRSDGAELTPAEERVAALAAAGLTNREVAAELFVSPKTVEATLSRAYRKLGIRSRAELGRWLAERDSAALSASP